MATADISTATETAALATLFPASVHSIYAGDLPADFKLFPAEELATSNMVAKRRTEFALGRYCARQALESLGHPPTPISKGPKREPKWPADIIGSITHTGSAAAAAVARRGDLTSLGLDMESDDPLDANLIAMICLPAENPNKDPTLAKLLFSIKEAIYKCLYPQVGTYIDFLEMEVHLSRDQQDYTVTPHTPHCDATVTSQLNGRYQLLPGLILSSAWIP